MENKTELELAKAQLKREQKLLKYSRPVLNIITISLFTILFYEMYSMPENKSFFFTLIGIVVVANAYYDLAILKKTERKRRVKIDELTEEIKNLDVKCAE